MMLKDEWPQTHPQKSQWEVIKLEAAFLILIVNPDSNCSSGSVSAMLFRKLV